MSETALLVVDVQNDVMKESVNSKSVITTIAKLVDSARSADVPVLWVQHSDPGMPQWSEPWKTVPQLVPADEEPIIHKTWGDSFVETDLIE